MGDSYLTNRNKAIHSLEDYFEENESNLSEKDKLMIDLLLTIAYNVS